MTEVTHDGPETFREEYPELAEFDGKVLAFRHRKTPKEFGGGYEVRLQTPNRTLDCETMETLAEKGYAVEYLGHEAGSHEWQIHECC